jgi:hypothetical protein
MGMQFIHVSDTWFPPKASSMCSGETHKKRFGTFACDDVALCAGFLGVECVSSGEEGLFLW